MTKGSEMSYDAYKTYQIKRKRNKHGRRNISFGDCTQGDLTSDFKSARKVNVHGAP